MSKAKDDRQQAYTKTFNIVTWKWKCLNNQFPTFVCCTGS